MNIKIILLSFFLFLGLFLTAISAFGDEYKTPSWQKRVITNYNYNQAVHGRESTTIENNDKAPSWQRRAIDSYNYDNAIHNKQKDDKRK